MTNKIYLDWCNSNFLSKEEKSILKNMSNRDIDNFFSEKKLSFGTAGIREIMGLGTNRLNRFVYSQLTDAYSKWLLKKNKNPKIIIAYDNRLNGNEFRNICAKVASSFGIEVYIIDNNRIKATPIVSFLIKEMKLDGAIIITASHNPKNYNGFKIYKKNGAQLIKSETDEVESYLIENKKIINAEYNENSFLIKTIPESLENLYLIKARKCLINTVVNKTKNFPIIFTPHHGTAIGIMKNWLNSIGYNNVIIVEEQNFIDPNFANSISSNPEDHISFEIALKYAKKYDAKIIIASDPDADRLGIVIKHEDEWRYLTGNESGVIFTEYVINNKKFEKLPMVVTTYVSTRLTKIICKKNNINFYETATGFKWLANKIDNELDKHDLVVAFEEAIGALNSTINLDKDSFQAAALILEIFDLCQSNQITLIDYLQKIYQKYIYWSGKTLSFQMDIKENYNWKEGMIKKMDFFKSHKPKKIADKYFLNSNWNEDGDCLEWLFDDNITNIKFRMSGTEPKFKIYIDAFGKSEEDSNNFLNKSILEISNLYYRS
ncbi:MAG: phospho-sugar mutase [Mycoplasmoidaceae bacterium]